MPTTLARPVAHCIRCTPLQGARDPASQASEGRRIGSSQGLMEFRYVEIGHIRKVSGLKGCVHRREPLSWSRFGKEGHGDMKRRQLITLIGGAAAWPLAAPLKSFAQQHSGKPPRIGWLVAGSRAEYDLLLEEYRHGSASLVTTRVGSRARSRR